jgi:ppGpp synthetase/RelA/SpoT-type nucleotidyltranferase
MPTVNEAVDRFTGLRPQYEKYSARVADLLVTLMNADGIRIHTSEQRAKTVDSFREKIQRPGKSYADPIAELPDLCGIRIIVYHPEDVIAVEQLVRNEFKVDEDNSGDAASRLAANEFGYLSVHLVVSLSTQRKRLAEWKLFSNFRAEIQIRTVLQHAWADISHALQYKNDDDVPDSLKRKLFLLSGLLELADEEFSRLRAAHLALAKDISTASSSDIADQEINLVTLQHYIIHADNAKIVNATAEEVGFDISMSSDLDGPGAALSGLSEICALAQVETVSQLDAALARVLRKHRIFLKRLITGARLPWGGDRAFIIQLLLIWAFPEIFTVARIVDLGWDQRVASLVVRARSPRRPSRKKKRKSG